MMHGFTKYTKGVERSVEVFNSHHLKLQTMFANLIEIENVIKRNMEQSNPDVINSEPIDEWEEEVKRPEQEVGDEGEMRIVFHEYRKENYAMAVREYCSGQKRVNIHATAIVFKVINKSLQLIQSQVALLLEAQRNLNFDDVKRFVLLMNYLSTIEVTLFAAMDAPEDDLFYQEEDSEDW